MSTLGSHFILCFKSANFPRQMLFLRIVENFYQKFLRYLAQIFSESLLHAITHFQSGKLPRFEYFPKLLPYLMINCTLIYRVALVCLNINILLFQISTKLVQILVDHYFWNILVKKSWRSDNNLRRKCQPQVVILYYIQISQFSPTYAIFTYHRTFLLEVFKIYGSNFYRKFITRHFTFSIRKIASF